MKAQVVLTLTVLGALFSMGYTGSCEYQVMSYQSNTGNSWTINAYFKDSTAEFCLEDPHVQCGCSHYSGGCSTFKGVTLCFDDETRRPCISSNQNNYLIVAFYACSSSIGCSKLEAKEQDEFYHWLMKRPQPAKEQDDFNRRPMKRPRPFNS